MKGKSRAVIVAAGLGTVLSLSIATSAPAAVTGLDIGSSSLAAKGLIATVPVTFTCDPGATYSGYLSLRQVAQQKTITGGEAYFSGWCTGEPQTVTLQVRPGPKPFKKGTTLAETAVDTYCYVPEWDDYEFCGTAHLMEEIQLR